MLSQYESGNTRLDLYTSEDIKLIEFSVDTDMHMPWGSVAIKDCSLTTELLNVLMTENIVSYCTPCKAGQHDIYMCKLVNEVTSDMYSRRRAATAS